MKIIKIQEKKGISMRFLNNKNLNLIFIYKNNS